jgi:hypothetical protein
MMRSHTYARRTLQMLAVATIAAGSSLAMAAVFPETEPNDTKFTANPIGPFAAGDMIVGNTQGSSTTVAGPTSSDNFLVRVAPAPLGIYQHRLVITSPTVGHTGSIRALSQTAAPPDTLPGIPWDGVVGTPNAGSDIALQSSSTVTTPPRYNQWYGFGRSEQLYYRVAGTTATVDDYTVTMQSVPVTPVSIGTYVPGAISITTLNQGHTSDTDMWVYDSNFSPMAGYGNDDANAALSGAPIATTSLQSWLSREYAPGTYYLALSNFHLSNNQPSASDDNFRTGTLMDFPDIIVNSSTTINLNMTFTITDSAGNTLQVANTKLSQFDVNWFEFTVVPEPTTLGLLALGLPMMLRRRKH